MLLFEPTTAVSMRLSEGPMSHMANVGRKNFTRACVFMPLTALTAAKHLLDTLKAIMRL